MFLASSLILKNELSATLPLLSYLGITYSKNEVVHDVLGWFIDGINLLNYGNPMQELRMAISESDVVRKLMLEMIEEMDLDIVDFRIEEIEEKKIQVFTKHVVDDFETELNLLDESSGTRKLFGLLPFIAKSLLKGTTLVIDELDAKIHPVLLKYLIMTFSDMEKNKKGAQLIFTSHDLSTMNSDVFRRDEIWFVAKGNRLAIRYAKRIIENNKDKMPLEIAPGTRVYELVEELAKYLPEDEKRRFKDD